MPKTAVATDTQLKEISRLSKKLNKPLPNPKLEEQAEIELNRLKRLDQSMYYKKYFSS